ncbi:3-hydroxybutyrate dehydrogenase [Maricaulis sp. W15]|uniref:3-hydroxybutyrate dehydrogenase n=1 Tax=Maricaulis maris TaxID=74318 RepID=A0A495D105_9PROT|nr:MULTISPECIES: 3-hydroxybutyrate dehydrogenase [Maricaulis]OLF72382.1 3-hydroxybutyrate dehydrogenase [Maricaulis sp. W15]RKQ95143.1 3-hydroxybutyrate dehydrogenase [Maricaulis maris]
MSSIRTDLSGQVAIITGSTSGIGAAMAEALAQNGCHIILNGLGDTAEIETLRAKIAADHGVEVRYHPANMLKPDEIADMVASAEREFGRLDILLSNAGIQHVSPVEDFPAEKWDAIIAINLTSVFHAAKAAIPIMKRQGKGRIVNLASAHGLVASPFKSAYVAAKHGVMGFTKTLGLELAEDGITCNAICPGYVKTPLVENQIADTAKARGITEDEVVRDVMLAAQPTKKFVTYEQLAGALLYLVSDAGANMNGSWISVDGGWTAK